MPIADQLHHQLASAEADYEVDNRSALMAMGFVHTLAISTASSFLGTSADPDRLLRVFQGNPLSEGTKPPLETSTKIFVEKDGAVTSPAAWARGPQPGGLHDWISQEEFDYYVNDFEQHGWNGGLSWYRVMDINVVSTPQMIGKKVTQPCQFVRPLAISTASWFPGGIS